MQPSQADVIAATTALNDSLRRQKDALDRQVVALTRMSDCLLRIETDPDDRAVGLSAACSEFVLAHASALAETASSLSSAIAHNERVLAAHRSSIIVPGLHATPRKQ